MSTKCREGVKGTIWRRVEGKAERGKALLSKYVNQLLYVAVQIVHQFDSRGYSDEIN